MPISPGSLQRFISWEIQPEQAHRTEKKLWSNCVTVELLSFVEWWKVIRVISKQSRLGAQYLESSQAEYNQIKHQLWNLIPNQVFFLEKQEWNRSMVTAFCSPVTIAYDIFASDENWNLFKKEIELNPLLQDDIDMFIVGYRKLLWEWFIVDLFGDENLVITREWRLKYIDSFLVNMEGRKSLKAISEERFAKIEKLWTL